LCDDYPCKKYDGVELSDSFITHKNQFKDLEKAKTTGMDAYKAELDEKVVILKKLLAKYNDGQKKSFYCLAVNLLDLQDIKIIMKKIDDVEPDLPLKEKTATVTRFFNEMAEKRGISLKLRK
jgi:hypothetical protein